MKLHFNDCQISNLDTDDYLSFFNLIENNRKRLEDYFSGTVSKTKTKAATIEYCTVICERIKTKEYFPYVIIDKKSKTLIGLIDVKNIDWRVPKAELGYFIDYNYEGHGIITKALSLVIDFLIAHYQFKKLFCRINSKNIGSIKVATKNGFEFEGQIRSDYKTTSGEIVDMNYYGRIF